MSIDQNEMTLDWWDFIEWFTGQEGILIHIILKYFLNTKLIKFRNDLRKKS